MIKHTTCFSGYRPEKFKFELEDHDPEFFHLQETIRLAVEGTIEGGYRRFLCGMAAGFDLLCAEVILDLKRYGLIDNDEAWLVAVLPYGEHKVSSAWQPRHDRVLEAANEVVVVAPKYRPGVYYQRNRYMVEKSYRLICYYDGRRGGTQYTVRYAENLNLEIINLAEKSDFNVNTKI
ncbi:DUF1273 domain-containing protein [Deltaproteobacteria bacterium OttesenSCG-928-K17]|nr:DUF1273 domain-containing protein [Deltaproteobacteria bacterium OttesenSCG-928-K17]